ncbi:acyltransferase, partial [Porticoccaceae bacterium]|nr:acyltransferase [Porticoccaceae bacterium]
MQSVSRASIDYFHGLNYLRALAVLLVLFDHAGINTAFGHLGVDVFFVISGFVITYSLMAAEFSTISDLRQFMARRSARLLPAMIVTLILVFPLTLWVMPASQFSKFVESFLSAGLLSSNIYFWLNVGYFDGLAELKPLIHTWSLGIEWQFYILFGCFLVIIQERRARLVLVSIAALLSLGTMLWFEGIAPVATFYLLPPRAWELLAGVILAFCLDRLVVNAVSVKFSRVLFMLVSSSIVVWCCSNVALDFGESTRKLITVFLTLVAIILAIQSKFGKPIGRSVHGVFYVIGISSYSIYLLHQPLLALLKIEIQQTSNI